MTNLRILSKVIEVEQINLYLESNNFNSKSQSAFRCSHSTETALKVFDVLLFYLDESLSVMCIGLDLSEAFVIIDHQFIFDISEMDWFAIFGVTVNSKYLSHSLQQIIIKGCLSDDIKVKTGVPQGSDLGPLLFSCYILPYEDKLKKLGIIFYIYADDTVLCFVCGSTLSQCIFDNILTSIHWFSNAKLKLNADKSEYLIIRKSNC